MVLLNVRSLNTYVKALTPPCFAKLLIADYGFDFFDSGRHGDQDAVLRFDVENQVVCKNQVVCRKTCCRKTCCTYIENKVAEVTYCRKYKL
jgi:hypothetical protein